MTNDENTVVIFTDGACSGNPGPGGWAFVIKYSNGEIKEFSGSEKYTTNNKMELLASIMALRTVDGEGDIEIYTDSSISSHTY